MYKFEILFIVITTENRIKSFNDVVVRDTLFKNKEVLKKGYVPKCLNDLLHRDDIIQTYINYLSDAMNNCVPNNIFIFGKTGVGKTVLTELILKDLEHTATKHGINILSIYLNCETVSTDTAILKVLINQMWKKFGGSTKKIINSFDEHFGYFCKLIDSFDGVPIIIFDEVDKLKNPDIINVFSRVRENKFISKNICIIGITNDLLLMEQLDPRTLSALSQQEIVVPPYDAIQLGDILEMRAKLAFKDEILDEMVIPLCAALAAQERGDARKALDLLRFAGELAERNRSPKITIEHVREAQEKIENDSVGETINTLPIQSKLVLLSCAHQCGKNSKTTTRSVYDLYQTFGIQISIDVLTQRRISDLISELNMLGIISIKKISRGRYGVKNEISLNISPEHLIDTLHENYTLGPLIDMLQISAKQMYL